MFVFQYGLSDVKSGNPLYLSGNETSITSFPRDAGIQHMDWIPASSPE